MDTKTCGGHTTLGETLRAFKFGDRVTYFRAYTIHREDAKLDEIQFGQVLPTAYGNQFRHRRSDFLNRRNLNIAQGIQVNSVDRFAPISQDVHGILDCPLCPVESQCRGQVLGNLECTLCEDDRNFNSLFAFLPVCQVSSKYLKTPQPQRYDGSSASSKRRGNINPVFRRMTKRGKWPDAKSTIADSETVANKHRRAKCSGHAESRCSVDPSTPGKRSNTGAKR